MCSGIQNIHHDLQWSEALLASIKRHRKASRQGAIPGRGVLFQNLSLLLKEQLENCPFNSFFFPNHPTSLPIYLVEGFERPFVCPALFLPLADGGAADRRWWRPRRSQVAADPEGAELCCHIFPSVVALNSL